MPVTGRETVARDKFTLSLRVSLRSQVGWDSGQSRAMLVKGPLERSRQTRSDRLLVDFATSAAPQRVCNMELTGLCGA